MGPGLVLVIGAGGVAYYVSKQGDVKSVPAAPGAPSATKVNAGGVSLAYPISTGSKVVTPSKTLIHSLATSFPAFTQQGQRAMNDRMAEVEKKARDEFAKLSSEAKRAGAKALNDELGLNPPLRGDEGFDAIAKVVGSAGGAAAGNAICGPLCGKLGAMIGAYLGEKIGEWLSDEWGDVKKTAEKYYNRAKNYLGGLLEDAGEAISDAASALNPF